MFLERGTERELRKQCEKLRSRSVPHTVFVARPGQISNLPALRLRQAGFFKQDIEIVVYGNLYL